MSGKENKNTRKKEDKSKTEKDNGDLSDLFSLKIFGVEIGDFLKDVDGVRAKLLSEQDELQKKFGDKVHVDIGIKVSGLDERRIIYRGDRSLADISEERRQWRRRAPIVITDEDVRKAREEQEKKKKESEEDFGHTE